jgi:hypothetical protein
MEKGTDIYRVKKLARVDRRAPQRRAGADAAPRPFCFQGGSHGRECRACKTDAARAALPRALSLRCDGHRSISHYPTGDGSRQRAQVRISDAEEHKKKVDWPALLDQAGLGDDRLVIEINRRLNEVRTVISKHGVVDSPDGSTRMRATELLAELRGKRKTSLSLSGPGGGPIPVQIIDDVPAGPSK